MTQTTDVRVEYAKQVNSLSKRIREMRDESNKKLAPIDGKIQEMELQLHRLKMERDRQAANLRYDINQVEARRDATVMLLEQPEPLRIVKHETRRTGRVGAGTVYHDITLNREPVNRDEAQALVIANGWFGYHPAGYGGGIDTIKGNQMVYSHSGSCD